MHRHNLRMLCSMLVALVVLAGCSAPETIGTAPPATTVPVTRKIDLRPMCGTVKTYSLGEEATLGAAIQQLDKTSPIIPAMGDYKRMRDEARACAAAAK